MSRAGVRRSQQLTPGLTWDLRLSPSALEAAYWQLEAGRLAQRDKWACWVIGLLATAAVTLSLSSTFGLDIYMRGYAPFWLLFFGWLGCMARPAFYRRHRLLLVCCFRVLLVVLQERSMALVRHFVADPNIGRIVEGQPKLTLLLKTVGASAVLHHLVESTSWNLPWLLNVAHCGLRAGLNLFGGMHRVFIQWGNAPPYLAAAHVLLHMAMLHLTGVMLTAYFLHLERWAAVRAWLRSLLECLPPGGQQDGSDVVRVGSLRLSREQVASLLDTPASAALLDPLSPLRMPACGAKAATGAAIALAAHAVAIGVTCQAALLLSELLVYQALPRLLTPDAFESFYPIAGLGWYTSPWGELPPDFEQMRAAAGVAALRS